MKSSLDAKCVHFCSSFTETSHLSQLITTNLLKTGCYALLWESSMENPLLAITVGIWMGDPSRCITYKPAALKRHAQHAHLSHNKMRVPQNWRITAGALIFERKTQCFINDLLLYPPAAFIKERKMGLNDFIQKLVSTPHICQQWVFPLNCRTFGLKCGTVSLSEHHSPPGSSIYF